MKLELNNRNTATFKDIEVGEAFYGEYGEDVILFIRIEVDDTFTKVGRHDGLAVSLATGHITWFDDCDMAIKANVKVVDA
jgi:hypothetical protein